MSLIQKLFIKLAPATWASKAEAESREWMIRCRCGHQRSVWEMGGIRWGATGKSRTWLRCPACGNRTWHTLVRVPAASAVDGSTETAAQ